MVSPPTRWPTGRDVTADAGEISIRIHPQRHTRAQNIAGKTAVRKKKLFGSVVEDLGILDGFILKNVEDNFTPQ
ncbi:hypothetical protein JTE90_026768 [Oedothorax gibbosus]|uniref:Uncharacterized protein n=1 Tax=Oedothorax gibbosus TaxID=931172 RepID=A0AAV6UYB8_9ARAC|nr:hypothetical protein JTE90_026768 [Oedothorax gibbosus]